MRLKSKYGIQEEQVVIHSKAARGKAFKAFLFKRGVGNYEYSVWAGNRFVKLFKDAGSAIKEVDRLARVYAANGYVADYAVAEAA